MSAAWSMVLSSLLFSAMGVCVKLASAHFGTGEIVMARGLVGVAGLSVIARMRRMPLRTPVPAMHLWRSVVGVASLTMWFYALGHMPLGTGVTLNYMSSVWMALFLIGGAVLTGAQRVDPRLVATVLTGFAGVALVLQPSIGRDQLLPGLVGLGSGVLSALAYLQVATLGRAGEPELRVVYYFSWGGFAAGLVMTALQGPRLPDLGGLALLVATGVFATAAQLALTRAYAIGRPLTNASLQYLGIAFSFAFGVVLFHDPLTASALGGVALIVGAGLTASRLRARTLAVSAPDTLQMPPDS
ncbi:MAG TPA: DMT family transporter [Burkholderiaceae bacterium]